jgi:hypothetical protein
MKVFISKFGSLSLSRYSLLLKESDFLTEFRVCLTKALIIDHCLFLQLVAFANAVEHEMRTTIIQAVEVSPGRYGTLSYKNSKYLLDIQVFVLNYNLLYSCANY